MGNITAATKPRGRSSLKRLRHRDEDNIILREVGHWTELPLDNFKSQAFVRIIKTLRVHLKRIIYDLTMKISRTILHHAKRQSYPCNRPWRTIHLETSRLPHFLDNRLTDDGEVVSLTRRPPFPPRMIPGTHFY
jgi:hypothetical protein